ncbi:hypothetical protein QQX98_008694 [Neonectria punicea]|uniref:Uncharacterized protein n=1 Tax=Neonectria punicea TaxID=979145 RepID=A0ABR1GUF9_9HYPO
MDEISASRIAIKKALKICASVSSAQSTLVAHLETLDNHLEHLSDLLSGGPRSPVESPGPESSFLFKVAGRSKDTIQSLVGALGDDTNFLDVEKLAWNARRMVFEDLKLRYLLVSCPALQLRSTQSDIRAAFCNDSRTKLVEMYINCKRQSVPLQPPTARNPSSQAIIFTKLQRQDYINVVLNTPLPAVEGDEESVEVLRERVNALVSHLSDAVNVGPCETREIQWLRFLTCSRILSIIRKTKAYRSYKEVTLDDRMGGWLAKHNLTFQKFVVELEMELFRTVDTFASAVRHGGTTFLRNDVAKAAASRFAWTMCLREDQALTGGRFLYRGFVPTRDVTDSTNFLKAAC